MKVTLYKNCILNSHYTEVFRNKTLLDNYLAGIPAENKMTIEIDNTYMKLSDTLVFYLNGTLFDMYNYNYMVCENDNKPDEKIYCFIQSVEVGNEACRVSYICDVWSTFIGKWSLRDSLVSRSRKTKPNEFYELPFLPVTNGTIKQTSPVNHYHFAIIFEIQLYTLKSSGDTDKKEIRENYIGLFKEGDETVTYSYASASLIVNIVNSILSQQNSKTFTKTKTINPQSEPPYKYYYEVLNCYVVPAEWIKSDILSDREFSFNNFGAPNFSSVTETPQKFALLATNETFNIVESRELSLSISTFAVGFSTLYMPINYNCDKLKYKINIIANDNNFKIYVNTAQIGLKDVTGCFKMELPFSTANAGTLAQQQIADMLQRINGEINIANGATKLISGAIESGSSFLKVANSDFLNPTGITRGVEKQVRGVTDIYKGIYQIKAATAEKYVNTKSVANDTDCFLNAYYGFSTFSFLTNDGTINNFAEVQKAIDEAGYNVDYFVNDLDLGLGETGITDYNVVKFDFVRMVGVTEEINNIISDILLNGVKIWYTINV